MKLGTFVLQCIRTNRKEFLGAFRYDHKKGQYVTSSGGGSFNLRDAHIFDDFTKRGKIRMQRNDHPFVGSWVSNEWKRFYKCVPVRVKVTIK